MSYTFGDVLDLYSDVLHRSNRFFSVVRLHSYNLEKGLYLTKSPNYTYLRNKWLEETSTSNKAVSSVRCIDTIIGEDVEHCVITSSPKRFFGVGLPLKKYRVVINKVNGVYDVSGLEGLKKVV